jgi:lytic murein transglycosylase
MVSAVALGSASAQVGPRVVPQQPRAPQSAQLPRLPQLAQLYPPAQTYAQPAYSAPASTAWDNYKVRLAALARQQGVREATIQAYVPNLDLNQRAIDIERNEPVAAVGGSVAPLEPYIRRHVTESLIERGQARYSADYRNLQWIESRYGVDPAVLMAIYGHETSYGTVTGSWDLLQALGSLGYYGRRRELFENEFVAALKLIDQGVPRAWLRGSWAGATGFPHFLPSVVLRLRADGDGDGYADVWRDELDGLASIAAYLREAGWKPGVPWGIPVRIPAGFNWTVFRSTMTAPKCPQVYKRHSRWLSMREWRSLGIVPTGRSLPDNEMATLLEPDWPYQSGYLLTNNYRAILDYNCSNFYAVSVGVLADRIARR